MMVNSGSNLVGSRTIERPCQARLGDWGTTRLAGWLAGLLARKDMEGLELGQLDARPDQTGQDSTRRESGPRRGEKMGRLGCCSCQVNTTRHVPDQPCPLHRGPILGTMPDQTST